MPAVTREQGRPIHPGFSSLFSCVCVLEEGEDPTLHPAPSWGDGEFGVGGE